ncbi:MAG: hypothetical protein D6732_29135 [Methanobacteriota archaeon]|nr:MAG: hypothetical protein D6732_29135 [Euryarchaeota archaeon]
MTFLNRDTTNLKAKFNKDKNQRKKKVILKYLEVRSMTLTIAVHSLRGGTGKTLLSVNLAAYLVQQGFRVVILDMDLGAPSLQTYIDGEGKKRINDYFSGQARPDEFIFDATTLIGRNIEGKLFMGLADDKSEIISKITQQTKEASLDNLYKLISLIDDILPKDPWNADFVILDTSPGFSADSLNAVAAAKHLILMLRLINADISGTRQMLETLYSGLKPRTSLILNQVPHAFLEDDGEEYTKMLVRKHIIEFVDPQKVNVCGFIPIDFEVIEKEAEFAMYFLEGLKAQRPIHVVANPNGNLAKNMPQIADCFLKLAFKKEEDM